MCPPSATTPEAEALRANFSAWLDQLADANPSGVALDPGHRIPFHWPPHAISYDYHVLESDWSGRMSLDLGDETFEVAVARTPHGVFGRIEGLWNEARAETQDALPELLRQGVEPLFRRQRRIASILGKPGRYDSPIRSLEPLDLLKLLYCEDRDVANEARIEIEKRASLGVFLPSLVQILADNRSALRRSAQWCVLDLFEDLPSFAYSRRDENQAIMAMRDLLWNATDDYARTMFKAGVVLGGHMADGDGGPVLLECLHSPSKFGRRAAIHGLFHVVEWNPETRGRVVTALETCGNEDPDPLVAAYAKGMARDLKAEYFDHLDEPRFPEEGG